jgi:hypothetical protein
MKLIAQIFVYNIQGVLFIAVSVGI